MAGVMWDVLSRRFTLTYNLDCKFNILSIRTLLVHFYRVRLDPGKVWKILEFNVEIFKALKMIIGTEK